MGRGLGWGLPLGVGVGRGVGVMVAVGVAVGVDVGVTVEVAVAVAVAVAVGVGLGGGTSDRRWSRSWRKRGCCCSCWRWAWRTCWTYGPAAGRGPTVAVAEILSKTSIVSLHSRRGARIAACRIAVDHIEPVLALIQPQLEIGSAGRIGEINSAPFDIEDAVGGSASHRGIDTEVPPGKLAQPLFESVRRSSQ